jgi:6-phosphogluconolactonase
VNVDRNRRKRKGNDRENHANISGDTDLGPYGKHIPRIQAAPMACTEGSGRSRGRKCLSLLPFSYVREINTIREYRFDPNSGHLSSLFPESVNLPDIIGPRHLVWHPTKPILYSSNEQNPGVSAFDWHQDGQLSLRQSCAALEVKDQGGDSTASDIVITPDAKFLFVGIRGTAPIPDSIARFQIGEEGDLTLLGHTSVDKMPWGFSLSPDGGYLMVTAWVGATLSAFRIDEKGDLQKVGVLTTEKNISSLTTR